MVQAYYIIILKVLGLKRCLRIVLFAMYEHCRLGSAKLWLISYIFYNSGFCPVVFMANKLKHCVILGCFALSLPMWYQYTTIVNTFRLPHSYISICIDREAEKSTGWDVSVWRFSITQVFELEKSGIVTNSIFWPFSPEKARQIYLSMQYQADD